MNSGKCAASPVPCIFMLHSQKSHPVSVPGTGSIQFYYSIGPAMLNRADTVIPGNIPYQDLVFSTE